MDDDFDPYRQWLGIETPERPPTHYVLLGLKDYETRAEKISEAAERQSNRVKEIQANSPGNSAEKLLDEIAAAEACLLDPCERSGYNALLRGAKSRLGPSADPSPSAGQFVGDAARYLLLHGKRIWIRKVRLASAYRRLGRDVHDERRYPESLQSWHQRVDVLDETLSDLSDQRDRIRDEGAEKPSFWERVKRLARRVMLLARGKWVETRKRRALRKLGRAAYDEGGIGAGPEQFTVAIASLRSEVDHIDKKIDRLSAADEDQWITPKRLAWAFLACAAVCLFIVWWWASR